MRVECGIFMRPRTPSHLQYRVIASYPFAIELADAALAASPAGTLWHAHKT